MSSRPIGSSMCHTIQGRRPGRSSGSSTTGWWMVPSSRATISAFTSSLSSGPKPAEKVWTSREPATARTPAATTAESSPPLSETPMRL